MVLPVSKAWKEFFTPELQIRLGARAKGFRYIFDHLQKIKNPVIVETGTYREENNFEGDGCSTLLFDAYVDCFGGELYSVDIDPKACELARNATKHAQVYQSDSVAWLGTFKKEIDLLYLDSYNIPNGNWALDGEPAGHHLKELFAAHYCLLPETLVVVDDNIMVSHPDDGRLIRLGKGRLIYEMLEALGKKPVFDLYQIGWLWQEG